MSKKIGLLTIHDTTNFGSWLQAYALYEKVRQLGYDVEIIDYQCEGIELREKLNSNWLRNKMPEENLQQFKKQFIFRCYMNRFFRRSRRKYKRNNIHKSNQKYDLFLLGSDLVWDLNITYSDTTYLFDFLEDNKPRCAFAASDGRDRIPDSQRALFQSTLKKFDAIAVREESMKDDIESIYGNEVSWVCDPTLLFKADFWKRFVKTRPKREKYVLLYFTDGKGNLSRLARKYSRDNGLEFLAINKDFNVPAEKLIKLTSVSEFLTYIFYAEKVFTASYHGMMFSLIFNKQFVFFPFAPETRMLSVANRFGIQTQNIESDEFDVNRRIEYDSVNEQVELFRSNSIECLERMLYDGINKK